MSHIHKDSLGRKINSRQTLARKFNQNRGQLGLAKACVTDVLRNPELSIVIRTRLKVVLDILYEASIDLNIDYGLAKIRLHRKEQEQNELSARDH